MVAYRRSYDAIKDVGRNVTVAWKPDSTALAVTVATLHVIIAKKCHAWKGNSWIIIKKNMSLMRPCQGGFPCLLSEFKNVTGQCFIVLYVA